MLSKVGNDDNFSVNILDFCRLELHGSLIFEIGSLFFDIINVYVYNLQSKIICLVCSDELFLIFLIFSIFLCLNQSI